MKMCYCAFASVLFVICINVDLINGQFPPRLQIPGALLLPNPKPVQYRQQRVQAIPDSSQVPRLRRPIPNAIPIPIRPVVEEPEDPTNFDDEVTKLGISALQSAVRQAEDEEPVKQQVQFRPERPIPVLRENVREQGRENIPLAVQRPGPLFRQEVPQARPIQRQEQAFVERPVQRVEQLRDELPTVRQPVRQHAARQQVYQPPPQPFKQQATRVQSRPIPQRVEDDEYQGRTRKPPVQILRKFRTDNEDGSITWGYENEDGSFKEEVLGNDCITRGKYGYVDPDGMKREYSYETGAKCDEPEEPEIEELVQQGRIPTPTGRKPQPQLRPQQQLQYQ